MYDTAADAGSIAGVLARDHRLVRMLNVGRAQPAEGRFGGQCPPYVNSFSEGEALLVGFALADAFARPLFSKPGRTTRAPGTRPPRRTLRKRRFPSFARDYSDMPIGNPSTNVAPGFVETCVKSPPRSRASRRDRKSPSS
jgi:hypothetical protein